MSQTIGAFDLNYQNKSQQNNDVYHVIVASYQNEGNAINKINSLKNLGFVDSKIVKIENSKFIRVSLKSFKDKSDANIFLKENISTFKGAWILVDSTITQTKNQPKRSFNSNPTKIAPKPNLKEPNKDQPKNLGDKSFNVIIGTYQKEIFAYYKKWELEKKGYRNIKVISDKNKGSYLVSIKAFKNNEDAVKLKDSLKNSEYKNSWILVKENDNKQNKLINELENQNEDSQIVSIKTKNTSETVSVKNDSLLVDELIKINDLDSKNIQDQKSSPKKVEQSNTNINPDQQVQEKIQNQIGRIIRPIVQIHQWFLSSNPIWTA